nr:QWRF motif-containing protein 7 [Tanacetum cinerariifolium]
MDHLRCSGNRKSPSVTAKQPLPRLLRSNSENPNSSPLSTSNKVTKSRSISITKTRSYNEAEANSFVIPMSINTRLTSPTSKKKVGQDVSGRVMSLPRRKPTSPSAWALSPGRVAPYPSSLVPTLPPASPSPSLGGKTGGERGTGGISGVLKYFSKKKAVAASEEADRHCYKLMNNRLLQWRFANAQAETAMSNVKTLAEKKAFNAWLKILALRNSNVAKRMEVQKLENDIKMYHILNSQLFLLEKWSRMEAKNFEAVGRVVRKLSVAALNVPLVHDSKGDVLAVRDEMNTATTLLENMESTITKLSDQAEKSCYMLTELSIIAKQEKECLEELQTWMSNVESLKFRMIQEKERSLRAHLIQAN